MAATKALVQRPRPPEPVRLVGTHGWSFPSGHTATAVVVFGTATALTVLLVHGRAVRALALTVCPLMVGVVAFSRVELGVHWTTDVVASVVWTVGWLLLCALAVSRGSGVATAQIPDNRSETANPRRVHADVRPMVNTQPVAFRPQHGSDR